MATYKAILRARNRKDVLHPQTQADVVWLPDGSKTVMDALDDLLPASGGTITGDLKVNGMLSAEGRLKVGEDIESNGKVYTLDGTDQGELATKAYGDRVYLKKAGGVMEGTLDVGSGNPLIVRGHTEITNEGDLLVQGPATFTGTNKFSGTSDFAGKITANQVEAADLISNSIRAGESFRVDIQSTYGTNSFVFSGNGGAVATETYVLGETDPIRGTANDALNKADDALERLDGKVDKPTSVQEEGVYVYSFDYDGSDINQGFTKVTQAGESDQIARYDGENLVVNGTPTEDNHATNKAYVDGKFPHGTILTEEGSYQIKWVSSVSEADSPSISVFKGNSASSATYGNYVIVEPTKITQSSVTENGTTNCVWDGSSFSVPAGKFTLSSSKPGAIATEEYVQGLGFITSSALSPYAKSSEVNAELATKLDKPSTAGIINYNKRAGQEDTYELGSTAVANTIALRDENGRLQVANPQNDQDVATKSYVDNKVPATSPISLVNNFVESVENRFDFTFEPTINVVGRKRVDFDVVVEMEFGASITANISLGTEASASAHNVGQVTMSRASTGSEPPCNSFRVTAFLTEASDGTGNYIASVRVVAKKGNAEDLFYNYDSEVNAALYQPLLSIAFAGTGFKRAYALGTSMNAALE